MRRLWPRSIRAVSAGAMLAGAALAVATLAMGAMGGCSAGAARGTSAAVPPPPTDAVDTTGIIPAGFGSLRQEDIAIRVSHLGLTVRAIPLDERFIRTLAPDSYRALVAIRDSKRTAVDSIRVRAGSRTINLWYVSFISTQQGETRFSPNELVLTSQARDYRPLDIVPITQGFGDQRITQRQQAHALYIFDGAMDPNQPLTMTYGTQTGGDWQTVLRRVEGERARIRSRGGVGRGGLGRSAPVRPDVGRPADGVR